MSRKSRHSCFKNENMPPTAFLLKADKGFSEELVAKSVPVETLFC